MCSQEFLRRKLPTRKNTGFDDGEALATALNVRLAHWARAEAIVAVVEAARLRGALGGGDVAGFAPEDDLPVAVGTVIRTYVRSPEPRQHHSTHGAGHLVPTCSTKAGGRTPATPGRR